ncbi:MAG: hypothetical protein DRO23_00505 [Thermoprotei archaeon]|nr:MAG: hypothetical protein DRO23_00505 [Thermoprotei archaeon]
MYSHIATMVLLLNTLTSYFMFLLCRHMKKPGVVALLLILTYNISLLLAIMGSHLLSVLVFAIMIAQICLVYIIHVSLSKVGAFSSASYFALLLIYYLIS